MIFYGFWVSVVLTGFGVVVVLTGDGADGGGVWVVMVGRCGVDGGICVWWWCSCRFCETVRDGGFCASL